MSSTPSIRVLTGVAATLAIVQPAAAHHFMDGTTPATAAEGLLSGLAHPLIGLDHLLFLIAAATLLAAWRRAPRLALAALFAAGALTGTAAHLGGANLPVPESLVALTLLGAAGALAFGRALPAAVLGAALGLAGGLHGYVYAETVVGAEQTPLAAYLVGFTLVQLALLAGLSETVRAAAPRLTATLRPRLRAAAAALVALGGLLFLGLSLAP